MQIARGMRGEEGARLVDEAWRTAGVRELVNIPLFLTALLSLPTGVPFPTTKEEVLRHFVAAHEKDASRAESLHSIVQDFHEDYLDGLAALATRMANTAIADAEARRCVSETALMLVSNGQIAISPEPNAVLDVLVSNHVLMRADATTGVSFQHQQFQEWYASQSVERRIIADVNDTKRREALKSEVFNLPEWEEAILFAVERMSRGNAHQRTACGKAILAAFEVDPILAADMIFRSTEDVWAQIAETVQALVARWHVPKSVDRAFRFMLMSGRAEFLDAVWPLLTDENEQVSLRALRNCKRFRPSILGEDAAERIKVLPQKPRLVLLQEMAWHSGMDGLELATGIAQVDPNPEVKFSVVAALAFRRADRHVALILRNTDEATFDLVVRRHDVDEIDDINVRQGIEAARKRMAAKETSIEDRLRLITYADDAEDRSVELTEIISTMEFDRKQDAVVRLVYEARNRYAPAVMQGLLARVRAGRELFYGTDNMLASAGFILEDAKFLELALANPTSDDHGADAASSVLGPKATGEMIDALLELATRARNELAAGKALSVLKRRIEHVPGSSLLAAIVERSRKLDSEQMAQLAALVSRRRDRDSERGRGFGADAIHTIQMLVQDWGKRMLASGDAQRRHKAAVATLASHVPDVSLLPLLKEMLDDNLRRLRDFRAQAEATKRRASEAQNEAGEPMTHVYQRAFLAIRTPETAALMKEYLEDLDFDAPAARVLADQWRTANEPPKDRRFLGGIDWSEVAAKRTARLADPAATCDEAEAIFAAIDRLIADGATQKQQKQAVALGIIALRLPHGQRDETIRKLIAVEPGHRYDVTRSDLLLSLVLSGEEIDIADVIAGVKETIEKVGPQVWTLTQHGGFYLKTWLQLLPFVNKPVEGIDFLLSLPIELRDVYFLRDLVLSYAYAPAGTAEEALFKLAEADARFYFDRNWREAVIALGSKPSARRLIDLVASGALSGKSSSDDRDLVRQLCEVIERHEDLRSHVYGLLQDGAGTPGLAILAEAVAEGPDEEGLLVLVKCDQGNRSFRGWRTIEKAVTEKVPVDGYQNAYNVVPIPAVDLRRKLLAMTTDGGPEDVAARWLNRIDGIRDEYGLPGGEPRHPDLSSGKPWPILTPNPDATAA